MTTVTLHVPIEISLDMLDTLRALAKDRGQTVEETAAAFARRVVFDAMIAQQAEAAQPSANGGE